MFCSKLTLKVLQLAVAMLATVFKGSLQFLFRITRTTCYTKLANVR